MGSKAMDIIFQKIHQNDDSQLPSSNYINTGFELVMRKSTR
jgi:hypothetical protein